MRAFIAIATLATFTQAIRLEEDEAANSGTDTIADRFAFLDRNGDGLFTI